MKILIITGSLVQDHEFIYPFYRLQEDNNYIDIALKNALPVKGILGTPIPPKKEDANIIDYEKIYNKDYDLLILPGGAKAMEYLRQEKIVLDFISKFNQMNKIIGCICHGAQLLISAKILKTRKVTGYYSIKDDIINAGAEYINEAVVVDNNIITSPHYKFMGQWMREVLNKVK